MRRFIKPLSTEHGRNDLTRVKLKLECTGYLHLITVYSSADSVFTNHSGDHSWSCAPDFTISKSI